MKRILDDDDMDSSVIPKRNTYKITEADLNSPIEKIPDCENIDLNPFEKSVVWPEDYHLQLNLQRRPFNFQIELVQSVIKSENSLVCLRTGAGKTYIAALLIKYYYLKKKQEKPSEEFLSFFFVPHRAIRDQQVTAIRDVGDLRVIGCDDDSSANTFVHYNHVVVCTPQKFLNCLLDKTILLTQIDLMIFDECHNCIGNHPYARIMEQYLVYHPNVIRPRIIGLTASCGTKLTNPKLILKELENEEQRRKNALKKLYELCGTLNCFDIATVTKEEHNEELNKKIPRPVDDGILTVTSLPFDRFLSKLKETLTSLLAYIGSRCSPVIAPLTNEQKLVEEKQKAEKENNFINVILIKYMIMFVKRFNALSDLPLKSIMIDIIQKLDLFYKQKEEPVEIETDVYNACQATVNDLVEQLKGSEYYLTNPKLDFLKDLLRKQIEKRDENTRGLVLVSRTLYAKLMFDYFKECEDIQDMIKPCWLVGQSGVDYQNSLSEQDQTLTDFRRGLANVMIATDIVQEGLDVAECSFVIRYEFVSNEIGTVQSRGRARAEKSSCFLVVGQDSDNYTKERTNRLKVMEMDEALNNWKRIPTDQLTRNIRKIQQDIIDEWLAETKHQELLRANLTDPTIVDGKVSCRSCDYYLGELSWIRKRANCYFVRHQQFFDNVETERYPTSKIYHEIQLNGKVRCGNKQCRQDLGGAQQYTDRPDVKEMCALKCKQLKFTLRHKDRENQVFTVKNWTDITFKILDLEPLVPNKTVSGQE